MAEEKNPALDPSTTSAAYDSMVERWTTMTAVLGGTETMRQAGEMFLPKHEAESDGNWQERLDRATLRNFTEITLESLAGRPFSDGVKLNDDVPTEVADLEANIDTMGTNLESFAYEWFREGFAKAFSAVLVDMPETAKVNEDGTPRTKAQDNVEQVRPYWCRIAPEDLICVRTDVVNGHERIVHVRIKETDVEAVGFAEQSVQRIRMIEPGQVVIFRYVEAKEPNKEGEWVVEKAYETDFKDEVPLVLFYADREMTGRGKPPLLDLAFMNIEHYQSSSDQRNILTVGRFPMLAGSGVLDDEGKIKMGPRQLLFSPTPEGKYYYVEHTGAAINSGRQDIQDLEAAMMQYGAEFLKSRPRDTTASSRMADSAESQSKLQAIALSFKAAVERAIYFTAKWLGAEVDEVKQTAGTVTINTDLRVLESDPVAVTELRNARNARDISRKAWAKEMKARGVLSDDYDAEADLEELDGEAMLGMAGAEVDPMAADEPPADAGGAGDKPGDKMPAGPGAPGGA